MLQKVANHVIEALLEEAHSEDKKMLKMLQQFNKAYNIIAENSRGEYAE